MPSGIYARKLMTIVTFWPYNLQDCIRLVDNSVPSI